MARSWFGASGIRRTQDNSGPSASEVGRGGKAAGEDEQKAVDFVGRLLRKLTNSPKVALSIAPCRVEC